MKIHLQSLDENPRRAPGEPCCLQKSFLQRMPWGGGKKRGVENLTNDTPPKGVLELPRTVRFPPHSGVSALFFLYKNPRQSRPEALLERSKNFRESAFSGTFSSPHTFCTPPYHGPIPSLVMIPRGDGGRAAFLWGAFACFLRT